MAKHYVAVDLGVFSGRVIVGSLAGERWSLKEMNRFWNGPTEITPVQRPVATSKPVFPD